MARFSSFLGRLVEVQYRASDTLLPASGVFVADSGRSIFLEQSFEQRGQHRHFRWEIPYQHLVRIGLVKQEEQPLHADRLQPDRLQPEGISAGTEARVAVETTTPVVEQSPQTPPKEKLASTAAAGIGLVSAVLPMSNRSKIA
jgi:hypothetical protein